MATVAGETPVDRQPPTRERATTRVPALGVDWLTPFYDAVAWLMGERAILRQLVEQARIAPGHDVLDLGCGTGVLIALVKTTCPGARVVGLDVDFRILAIARAKLARAGLDVALHRASATAPPFRPGSFDRVLTTLVLHHLTTAEKGAVFAAVRALLRPGGELHVADWGPPQNALMRAASRVVAWFDGADRVAANLRGELPALAAAAGLVDVEETGRRMTPFGTLVFLRAAAPA
jgi:ubiquinone/menaquinone biosynthesis C-methylase UbiE